MNATTPRRFFLAFVALFLCALLFHGQVATALITRGDAYFQKGRLVQARVYYRRALFFDRASTLAADRYVFSGLELRTPQAMNDAIAVASATLAYAHSDPTLLEDRGLLYNVERRYPLARTDFTRAAAITQDPRWYHLAAWAAYRSGDHAAAHDLWRKALHADSAFEPARLALLKTADAR